MKNKILNFYKSLPFTEKVLLLFMTIIYFQITYNLFFNELSSSDYNPIDTIVRTAAASIFGYFLGKNIEEKEEDPKEVTVVKTNYNKTKKNTIIISIIGIVSLLIMLTVRNFTTINTTSVSTLSQLKDFVSATVGFLVSKNNEE